MSFDIENLTQEDRSTLASTVREVSTILTQIEIQKTQIKSLKDDVLDKVDIPRSVLNKLVKAYHAGNVQEEVENSLTVEKLVRAIDDVT